MKHAYKKGKKVCLIETDYLHERYYHHKSENVVIESLVDESDWLNSYIPEYMVKSKSNSFKIPQNSIRGEV